MAASFRYRVMQYLPYLQSHGVRCTVSPLFDDRYLAGKFAHGRASPLSVVRAIARRVTALVRLGKYDLVVLQYEAMPFLPALCDKYLAARRMPYVYDFDDAIFHNYDQSRHALVRRLLSDKIGTVIRGAALVLAGSEYLADHARKNNPRVEVLPTVIDLSRYPESPARREPGDVEPFVVGWIGSPSTAEYLDAIAPALRSFAAETPMRLVLIGASRPRIPGVPLQLLPWTEQSEVERLRRFDVGIMPLPDTPWARGKCGFKLIQYMACGLPVIASPVGENRHIVEDGVNGLWARTPDEWLAALRLLRDDAALRARLGRAGRERVAARYCLQVTAPRLLSALLAAAGAPSFGISASQEGTAFLGGPGLSL
jgi:glycosyltransferase involved in cell wall biosynthesis